MINIRIFARDLISNLSSKSPQIKLTQNHHTLPENKARIVVLWMLIVGTTLILSLLLGLLLASYFIDGNQYIELRIVVNLALLLYLSVIILLAKKNRLQTSSALLVSLYALISVLAIWQWGIHIAFGILLISLTISLSGILLGARSSLYSGAFFTVVLILIQLMTSLGIYYPDVSWQTGMPSEFGEVMGYILLLAVLTLASWLFGQQTESALYQARLAESELIDQKQLLAVKLKERTEKLRASQLKEMQQLYRFAELGQLSTAIFHNLSNHLAVLSLDIEGLKDVRHKKALNNASESIEYIEELVKEVKQQISQTESPRKFKIIPAVKYVSEILDSRLKKEGVNLDIEIRRDLPLIYAFGDRNRFVQVLTVLVINGLEATQEFKVRDPKNNIQKFSIMIEIKIKHGKILISVSDWGVGVPRINQAKIFKPFYGTKSKGMGIGLFITRQIVETHFKGKIEITRLSKPTQFTITLPVI